MSKPVKKDKDQIWYERCRNVDVGQIALLILGLFVVMCTISLYSIFIYNINHSIVWYLYYTIFVFVFIIVIVVLNIYIYEWLNKDCEDPVFTIKRHNRVENDGIKEEES